MFVDLVEVVLHVPCAVIVVHEPMKAGRVVVQMAFDDHAFTDDQRTAVAARSPDHFMAGVPGGFDKMDVAHEAIVADGTVRP